MKKIVLDDMILTCGLPTTAGSKMLEGYLSLFDAQAVTALTEAGYAIAGKAAVGEFAIDLVGETAYDGTLQSTAAQLSAGDVLAAVGLDVNGSVRRAAAQSGLVSVKPTYGTVSRYGTIPVACSGETVSVTAKDADACREVLAVLAAHDDKDGTSLPEAQCEAVKASGPSIRRVAVLTDLLAGIDGEVQAKMDDFCAMLEKNGVAVCKAEEKLLPLAHIAWNILMCAELCNNVSRYDGVKFGYRSENYENIDELYTNSRTEAFGLLLKTAILFGSETLSTDNYRRQYDKALRIRRLVVEAFAALFAQYDAVLLPACSKMNYTEAQNDPYFVFDENVYTAPASITGLPAVVCGGVQLMGKAFSEQSLLALAALCGKEDRA